MIDKKLLHKATQLRGETNESVARRLGISRQSYQSRLNGTIQFKTDEIKKICTFLRIGQEDMLAIFFANNVK